MRKLVLVGCLALSGCSENGSSPGYTLYRNSPIDPALRVHFASFDAIDKGAGEDLDTFNKTNCAMAAEVLDANVRRLNNGKQPVQFWCENGQYRD